MNDLFSFMATHSGLATITLRLPYNHEKSAPLHENCSNGGGYDNYIRLHITQLRHKSQIW